MTSPKVRTLVDAMPLDDKIGQMAQIEIQMLIQGDKESGVTLNMSAVEEWIGRKGIGSVLNLIDREYWTAEKYRQAMIRINQVAASYGRPPVIWGMDSVHGANYIHKAIVTPQPLNLAASFNETVAFEAGKLASRDTRAAGINWLFSPLLGLSLSPRWSRTFETFGEDPLLVGKMAAAMIEGIQVPDANPQAVPSRAAACAKHFVGYSAPHNGHDRSPSWIPTRHLYQYFVPPWKRALVDAQSMTVMESFTETDGVPVVANPHYLNYLLRERLQFKGVLVTDFEEMRNLYKWHQTASTLIESSQQSLRRGSVDMSMLPYEFDEFRQAILEGLQSHRLSEERITISAERVLQLKHDLGMMDETLQMEDPNLDLVGTDGKLGMDMVYQSIVLAKNDDNFLPIRTTDDEKLKVLVTGPTANSRVYQSGGWTGRWQGVPLEEEDDGFSYGSSLLGAFAAESSLDVSYMCGVDILGNACSAEGTEHFTSSLGRAVQAAASSDVVVIAVGQEATTEKQGDIRSLDLPHGQYELVQHIQQNTNAKIILVFFGGRPRLLHDMVDQSDAVFVGFLPGPSAGQAIVDMVLGRVNPNARLPITYPAFEDGGGSPYFHAVSDKCTKGEGVLPHWEFVNCAVQWPFGHGLSYTTFEYSDFTAIGGIDRDLELSVTVRNTGGMGGAESVLFFTFDEFRQTTPEYKRLRAFGKVYLEPGAEVRVMKTVPLEELRFVGPDDDTHYILDPKMTAWAGVGALTDCRVNPAENALCVRLQSDTPSQEYVGACEAACDLWSESGCDVHYGLSKKLCTSICTSIARYPVASMDEGNEGWGWNYVRCLESVLPGIDSDETKCWKMTSLCRDIFQTGKMSEFGIEPLDGSTAAPPSGQALLGDNGSLAVCFIFCLVAGILLGRVSSNSGVKKSDIRDKKTK